MWDGLCFISRVLNSVDARSNSQADSRVTGHQLTSQRGENKAKPGRSQGGDLLLEPSSPARPYGWPSAEEWPSARESLSLLPGARHHHPVPVFPMAPAERSRSLHVPGCHESQACHRAVPEVLPPGTRGQLGGAAGPTLQLMNLLVL